MFKVVISDQEYEASLGLVDCTQKVKDNAILRRDIH